MKYLTDMVDHLRSFGVVDVVASIIGIFAFYCGIRLHFSEWKEKRRIAKRTIFLHKLVQGLPEECPVWKKGSKGGLVPLRDITGEEEKIIATLEHLAPIWRDNPQKDDVQEARPGNIAFRNKRIRKFYRTISKLNTKHLQVCIELLQLLEREGNCPSVVPWEIPDAETSFDHTTHQKLEKVSLLDHTLNVTELAIKDLKEQGKQFFIADAVVAALGHDLGKIPSKLFLVHHLEDHALPSAEVVNGFPDFLRLAKREEILEAIRCHHHDSENFLAQILRRADLKAREMEIKQAKAPEMPQQQASRLVTEPKGKNECETDSRAHTKEIDISGWFNADQFLEKIKTHINVIADRRFQAFSMPDGVVYVQTNFILDIVLDQANKANVLKIVMRNRKKRTEVKPILLAIIEVFRTRGDIVNSKLKNGYFEGYFKVMYEDETQMEGSYLPFHATAFLDPSESLEELEQRKTGSLLKILSVSVTTRKE